MLPNFPASEAFCEWLHPQETQLLSLVQRCQLGALQKYRDEESMQQLHVHLSCPLHTCKSKISRPSGGKDAKVLAIDSIAICSVIEVMGKFWPHVLWPANH